MLDLCFVRAIEFVQYSNPIAGNLLIKIHDLHADVFKEIANLVLNKHFSAKPYEELPKKERRYLEEIEALKRHRNSLYDEINELELQNAKYLETLTNFGLKSTFPRGLGVFNERTTHKSTTQLQNYSPNLTSTNKSPSKGTLRSGSTRSQKELVSS